MAELRTLRYAGKRALALTQQIMCAPFSLSPPPLPNLTSSYLGWGWGGIVTVHPEELWQYVI